MKLTLINQREFKRRNREITHLHKFGADNEAKVKYALRALKKAGKLFIVNQPSKQNMKMKRGNCYHNSIRKMKEGFEYVEGVIINKITKFEISHAWNMDSNGNHIDFTIMNTQDFEYCGVVIPADLIREIGSRNGFIWYCSLPYITVK